ncbi:DoxX family protein [Paenibacillus hodogayensis]|uniref:DoxX family protein n=1 Tax=Paenibacillus hodogayensis TaxID=279208 RepID=A0ABV5VVN0_9BACL
MTIVSIVLQSLLALLFLAAGGSKLGGAKQQVESFRHLGLPQWFRVITGLVQYIGVAGLIAGYFFPGLAGWAGLWLGVTMIGACLAHIRAKDPIGKSLPAFVIAVIAIVVFILNINAMANPFA